MVEETNTDHAVEEIPHAVGWFDLIGVVHVLEPHHRDNVDTDGVKVGTGDVEVQNKGLTPQDAIKEVHWLVYNPKG